MRCNATGFTLLEVLVAITVIIIATVGITSMGVTAMSADTQSRRTSVAAALAQAKLEELRVLRRSEAGWAAGIHTETVDENGQSGSLYTREWEVELDYDGFNNLSRVTVIASWATGEVSFTSLYR